MAAAASPPPPTMGNFMGVVTRETRRLRPRPPPPPSARGQKSPREVWGAAAGPAAPTSALTSSPHAHFLSRCRPLMSWRFAPGRPHRPGPRRGVRGRGQGTKPRPLSGLRVLSPTPRMPAAWGPSPGTGRPASGAPARPPSRPSGRRPAPTGPPGFGPRPAEQAWGWGWSWLPGTPREVKSFSLRGAEVHALTLWAQSFDSHHPHLRRKFPSNGDPVRVGILDKELPQYVKG